MADVSEQMEMHMMETLEHLCVDVVTLGNHDFDFGVCHARTLTKEECLFKKEGRQKRARSQWIMSNMTVVGGQPLAEAEPKAVKDHAGLSVDLMAISMNRLNLAGLCTNMTNPDKLAEWTDEVEMLEVDFFLGGHEQQNQETDRYVNAGYDYEDFCLLTVDVPHISVIQAPTVQRFRVPAEVPTTQELRERECTGNARRMLNLIDKYTKDLDEMQSRPLEPDMCLAEVLDTRKFMQRTQEPAAGNLCADAILEAMKTTLSTDVFFGNDTEACKLVSSCFDVVVLLWAPAPEPKTRSNTTNDRDLFIVIFRDIIRSCSSLTGPWIQSTSPNKWQIRSVQQSFGKLDNFEDNDEERDNTPEEIHETIYVKTINGKTISTRYYRNMTAAVILEEVERRTLIPRDMIRLIHKGKMISGKKSMKKK